MNTNKKKKKRDNKLSFSRFHNAVEKKRDQVPVVVDDTLFCLLVPLARWPDVSIFLSSPTTGVRLTRLCMIISFIVFFGSGFKGTHVHTSIGYICTERYYAWAWWQKEVHKRRQSVDRIAWKLQSLVLSKMWRIVDEWFFLSKKKKGEEEEWGLNNNKTATHQQDTTIHCMKRGIKKRGTSLLSLALARVRQSFTYKKQQLAGWKEETRLSLLQKKDYHSSASKINKIARDARENEPFVAPEKKNERGVQG